MNSWSSIPPGVHATTLTGDGVDVTGLIGGGVLMVHAVAGSGSDSLAVTLQTSSDDGGGDAYADIADVEVDVTLTGGVLTAPVNLAYCKKYVRAIGVESASFTFGVSLGGAKQYQP